jgi:hypothetical protein
MVPFQNLLYQEKIMGIKVSVQKHFSHRKEEVLLQATNFKQWKKNLIP